MSIETFLNKCNNIEPGVYRREVREGMIITDKLLEKLTTNSNYLKKTIVMELLNMKARLTLKIDNLIREVLSD